MTLDILVHFYFLLYNSAVLTSVTLNLLNV